MDQFKRILIVSVLLGLSTTTIASVNQCPAGSAFSHEGPNYSWKMNQNGWTFDQDGSKNSNLKTIPDTAKSYVLIFTGNGSVQCTYSDSLRDKGILNFDLIREMPVSKDNLSPKFVPGSYPNSYVCYFSAGDPSVCSW